MIDHAAAPLFSSLFLAAVLLSLGLRLWLNHRQLRHVAAHRESVPPAFADRIGLAAHHKAADYTRARGLLGRIDLLVDTGWLLLLTWGGLLRWLDSFWSQHFSGIAYGIALLFSVGLLSSLLDLPLSIYRQFVLEQRFGFNRMTPGLFVADLFKGAALSAVIGAPLLAAVLWLMGAMGEYWWLYVWLFWSAFNLLLMFIYPTWIAPLFNKFTPLPDGELRQRIEALLARCGFTSGGLFVMDGSRRSAHGNAYFTGFGRNKRIVFFDTLLEKLSPVETEAVLAHELGHFRLRHVPQRLILMFALSLAMLALLGQLLPAPWFYAGLGLDPATATGNTALALLLFFLALPVFTFPLTPLSSVLSRRHEYQADAYAHQHASSEALIQALVKLYEENAATLTPDPLHSLFYDSHPPAALRIAHLQQLQGTPA